MPTSRKPLKLLVSSMLLATPTMSWACQDAPTDSSTATADPVPSNVDAAKSDLILASTDAKFNGRTTRRQDAP